MPVLCGHEIQCFALLDKRADPIDSRAGIERSPYRGFDIGHRLDRFDARVDRLPARRLVEGATGNAGEVGHLIVKAGGPKCACGRRGCLEALASRNAIARRVGKAARKGADSVLAAKVDKKSGKLKSGDLALAYAEGDPVALAEVHRAARYLGLGLGGLVNLIGPEIIVLGGGVTEALGPGFVDLVRAAALEQILVDPGQTIKIEPAALGDDAGVLGAALLARERFSA